MHNALQSSFNALIMPCNAPYNALYYLMNNCNHTLKKLFIEFTTFFKVSGCIYLF